MRKDKFVASISNVTTFLGVIDALKEASRLRNPSIGIISAPYGIGKTETCLWYYTQNKNVVYMSIKASMSTRDFFEELLLELGGTPKGNLYRIFSEIVSLLRQEEEKPLILLDESNRLVEKKRMVEILRDLHDEAKVPILLVGSPEFLPLVRKFGAFHSRVRVIRHLEPLSLSDIKKIANTCLEKTSLSEDAFKVLKTETGGNTRQVIITLEALERYAVANNKEILSDVDVKRVFVKNRKAFEGA
ncbi:AAA family ATPase [Desulfurobacterium thermolithotrophum]|uniref:AAA family ATPase n=1 Tax=Desulfurobacterium thermolithotrophum TaxID=64160 RepID=UPI0013D46537|nr:AAA family ATPase [Desulfurobacterium thermolithotrophum]